MTNFIDHIKILLYSVWSLPNSFFIGRCDFCRKKNLQNLCIKKTQIKFLDLWSNKINLKT